MSYRFLLFVMFASAISSCKGYKEFKEARATLKITKAERKAAGEIKSEISDTLTSEVIFSMQRGYCYGTCPVFELKIYADRTATYEGLANVSLIGKYQTKYAHQLADSVLDAAKQIGFVQLMDSYDNQFISDLPVTQYSLAVDDRYKKTLCRVNCPERVIEFGLKVEKWLQACSWIKLVD